MKPVRRETSIFNVSAIDLFASALGAFMIVSFVLIPYFPNTGQVPPVPVAPPSDPEPTAGISPAELEALQNRLTRAEAALDTALARERALAQALDEEQARAQDLPPDPGATSRISPAELEALRDRLARAETAVDVARARERELAQALDETRARERELVLALDEAASSVQKLPSIDLIIALDTTSSMLGEVASLREEIAGLAELLATLTEDAAVGIIDFKDRCDPSTALRIAPLQRIDRRSVPRLTAFARSMRAGSSSCNTSSDEDYAEALRAAVSADWRADSVLRSIVMISDNPAHVDLQAQAITDARRFARRPGARHTVASVFVDTSATSAGYPPDTESFMQRVAQAGRGQFVRANENASLSVTILRAIIDD